MRQNGQAQTATIMDVTSLCRSFPTLPVQLIERANILNALDTLFTQGIQLIAIEGEEGIGKTTLLAQFARRHPQQTLALFARPTSRLAYDPGYLQYDLCNQAQWMATHRQLDSVEDVNDARRRVLLTQVEQRARLAGERVFILLDGLDDIPAADALLRDHILDLLPFGLASFVVLYGGRLEGLPETVRSQALCKPFTLTSFSLHETMLYFTDLGFNDDQTNEIHQLCHGLPGRLADVRRIVESGIPIQQVLDYPPREPLELFHYDWAAVQRLAPEDEKLVLALLGFLAHDRSQFTIATLARLTSSTMRRVVSLLRPLRFLRLSPATDLDVLLDAIDAPPPLSAEEAPLPTDAELAHAPSASDASLTVAFVSEAFRRYVAEQRLPAQRSWVIDRIVEDLSAHPTSDAALSQLPNYLAARGDLQQLAHFLSPEYFVRIIQRRQSLQPAIATVTMAISAVQNDHQDEEMTRLSLLRAVLLELEHGQIDREEIEARLALGDVSFAITMAQSAPLREDRLELLAMIGRAQRLHGETLSPELLDQIRDLAQQMNWPELGNRATMISMDLLYSIPEVAIDVMETLGRVSDQEEPGAERQSNAPWAWEEQTSELGPRDQETAPGDPNAPQSQTAEREVFQRLPENMSDPTARRFATFISVLFGGQTAEEVLNFLTDLPNAQNRLFMLRQWAPQNRRRDDAALIVDAALDLLLRSNETTRNAAIYRDLATPLPFIQEWSVVDDLVGKFDAIKDEIERLGPTIDYVRLQLLIAQAETRFDGVKAGRRLIEIWTYCTDRADLVERAECLARLSMACNSVRAIAQERGQSEPLTLRDQREVDAELHTCVQSLLAVTADQYQAVRGVLRAFAVQAPDRAIQLAQSLNTRGRRLSATLFILRRIIASMRDTSVYPTLRNAFTLLEQTPGWEKGMVSLARGVATLAQDTDVDITTFFPLLRQTEHMMNPALRCRVWCYIIQASRRRLPPPQQDPVDEHGRPSPSPDESTPLQHTTRQMLTDALRGLQSSWEGIDPGWRKAQIGYRIVQLLAPVDAVLARQYLEQTNASCQGPYLWPSNGMFPYLGCLDLAMRAYAGLLQQRGETETDRARITQVIGRIPAAGDRIGQWALLAVRAHLAKRSDECKRIVEDQVRPTLYEMSPGDPVFLWQVIGSAAPALYCVHHATAFEWIERVPQPDREIIYLRLVDMIVDGHVPGDPAGGQPAQARKLVYQDYVDLCEIAERIEGDWFLEDTISKMTNNVVATRSLGILSRAQQHTLAERLRAVIEQRLPQPDGIRHDGYKVLALSQIARIDPAHSGQPETWRELVVLANAIPNAADRAFVLASLAVLAPEALKKDREQWFDDAATITGQLPAYAERIEHDTMLAQRVLEARWGDMAAKLARKYLEDCIATAAHAPTDRATYAAERKAIDLAYQFDEDFAASLASRSDDDPARLRQRLETLRLKKRLTLQGTDTNKKKGKEGDDQTASPPHELMSLTVGQGTPTLLQEQAFANATWMQLRAFNGQWISAYPVEDLRDVVLLASRFPLISSYPAFCWIYQNGVERFAQAPRALTYLRPLLHAALEVADLTQQVTQMATTRSQHTAQVVLAEPAPAEPQTSSSAFLVVRPGERDKAERFIQDWCARIAPDYLKIADAYFGLEDLRWIRLMSQVAPECRFWVLTGRHHQLSTHVPEPWPQTYRLHWRLHIAEEAPPETDIMIVGTASTQQSPIHDRWILTHGGGLVLGTSLNSIGGSRETQITVLDADAAARLERTLDGYLLGTTRQEGGERLIPQRFTLS